MQKYKLIDLHNINNIIKNKKLYTFQNGGIKTIVEGSKTDIEHQRLQLVESSVPIAPKANAWAKPLIVSTPVAPVAPVLPSVAPSVAPAQGPIIINHSKKKVNILDLNYLLLLFQLQK